MRKPDVYIGGEENPYLLRWWLIPRNRFFNIYLHKFIRDDDDRALHDHPWWSVSFLLKGILREIHWTKSGYANGCWFYTASKTAVRYVHRFLHCRIRSANFTHRLELVTHEAWTLVFTGPKVREWGFHCPQGWKHWTLFTDKSGAAIGKGCAE
jgi:hypothetical protein